MYRNEKPGWLTKTFSFPRNDMHMGGFPTLTILEFIRDKAGFSGLYIDEMGSDAEMKAGNPEYSSSHTLAKKKILCKIRVLRSGCPPHSDGAFF